MPLIVPVELSGDIAKPSEGVRHGERRLVRLLPTPFGARPAIWTSPYETMESLREGTPPEHCRKCILLNSPGSPDERPDVICITIPSAAIDKFPLVPVEW
jgi:hypothetical protein